MTERDAEALVERLREMVDSGYRTMGGGSVGVNASGKVKTDMWGNEPIMRLRNPDGPVAADLIETLTAHIAGEPERLAAGIAGAVYSGRSLGWDADGMCDDHGRFCCPKCTLPAIRDEAPSGGAK